MPSMANARAELLPPLPYGMTMKLTHQPVIKPFASGDFDAWLPLWRAYQAFYKTDIAEENDQRDLDAAAESR